MDFLLVQFHFTTGLKYINNKYPNLKSIYEDIVLNDTNEYINELRNTWKNNFRIKFVFD